MTIKLIFLFDLFFHIGFILKLSNRFFFAQLRFDWSQKCGFANMLIGHFASELLWQKTQNFGSFLATCFISGLGFERQRTNHFFSDGWQWNYFPTKNRVKLFMLERISAMSKLEIRTFIEELRPAVVGQKPVFSWKPG